MIEWGPLQILPPGLLGALQLKNMGKNPGALSSLVQGTLELRDWLLQQNYEVLGATNAASVTDNFTGFQDGGTGARVPEGEWWYIHEYQVNILALATGDVVHAAPAYQDNTVAGGDTITVGPDVRLVPTATTASLTAPAWRQFFVPPNALFGGWILESNVAAALNLGCRIRMTRLPV